MAPPNPSSLPAEPREFDPRSFSKYVRDIGRAYKKRAAELVSICRFFKQGQDQTCNTYYDLRSAFELVDKALMSATMAGKKTSEDADRAFESAASRLVSYERQCGSKRTVAQRIKAAEEVDKSSLKVLNRLTENFRAPKEGLTIPVDFLLHKSLPDKNPGLVTQLLCKSSDLNEILWNFSRSKKKDRRLTLQQNPHFYKSLPELPGDYVDKFEMEPIKDYDADLYKRVSVLTDNSGEAGRVFLKTGTKTRAFGNVWKPEGAIIFKDVCGDLRGESRVGADLRNIPNLMCFKEARSSCTSLPPSPSLNQSSPFPTTTGTPTTSPTGLLLPDWMVPILQMLQPHPSGVNIHISTKPPTIKSTRRSTAPSSLFSQSGSSSSTSLPPTNTPESQSPISEPAPQLPNAGVPPSGQSVTTFQAHVARHVPDKPPCPGYQHEVTAPRSPELPILPTLASNTADTSLKEVSQVDPVPPEAGTAAIFSQTHTELHAAGVPTRRPAIDYGSGITTNIDNNFASGLITPPQRPSVVATPPKSKPNKTWIQKCVHVIKKTVNNLRP